MALVDFFPGASIKILRGDHHTKAVYTTLLPIDNKQ
jgi:hypothetical protein